MIDLKLADKFRAQYQKSFPSPYLVIDNFLPEFLLRSCKNEILKHEIWYSDEVEWTQQYQKNKLYYPNYSTEMSEFQLKLPITTLIMEYLNSSEFIKFLENLTGFEKLYRDPQLMGGGIHRIKQGGKLSIHKDFNEHPATKKLRRLNLLIYLNENWNSDWNGNLELWCSENWKKIVEIEPIFNRAVIFDIKNSPHGHPHPLNTPSDVDRYSLAFYYFTDDQVPEKDKRTVVFYDDEELGLENSLRKDNLEDLFK